MTAADEVWHELVLHGIGGATIEEAKERLSYAEYLDWCAYINKRGSLNAGVVLEWGFALIASILNNAHRGKAKMIDFMPHFEKPEEVASIQSVFATLKAKAKAKR